jgi:hypothetical protein
MALDQQLAFSIYQLEVEAIVGITILLEQRQRCLASSHMFRCRFIGKVA